MKKILLLLCLLLMGCTSINKDVANYDFFLDLLRNSEKSQMKVLTNMPNPGYSFTNVIDLSMDPPEDENLIMVANDVYDNVLEFYQNTKLTPIVLEEDINHFQDYWLIFTIKTEDTSYSYTIWNNYMISIEDNNTMFKNYQYYTCDHKLIDDLFTSINTGMKDWLDFLASIQ